MKKQTILALAVLAIGGPAAPSVAGAQLSFNVGAVTDYRYRGISQTRLTPAMQGGVDYTHSGLYLGAWSSMIKWVEDAGGDASAEIDLYAGYRGEIRKNLGYDVGVLTYQYPRNRLAPSVNTSEIYVALTSGPVTAKYSDCMTDLFGFARSHGSNYVELNASFDIGGVSVAPHLGHQEVKRVSSASYTDYALAVSKEWGRVVWSATLIGTNTNAYAGAGNQNLGKAGFLLGAKRTF